MIETAPYRPVGRIGAAVGAPRDEASAEVALRPGAKMEIKQNIIIWYTFAQIGSVIFFYIFFLG